MENKPKSNKNTLEENEIISERGLSKILLLYKYWNTLIPWGDILYSWNENVST